MHIIFKVPHWTRATTVTKAGREGVTEGPESWGSLGRMSTCGTCISHRTNYLRSRWNDNIWMCRTIANNLHFVLTKSVSLSLCVPRIALHKHLHLNATSFISQICQVLIPALVVSYSTDLEQFRNSRPGLPKLSRRLPSLF